VARPAFSAPGALIARSSDETDDLTSALRILILDSGGYALDFAMRCRTAGHQVKWHIAEAAGRGRSVGRGLFEPVRDWRRWMPWADLVFLPDNALYLRELAPWRRRGYPIFGPSAHAARLELDRAFGQQMLVRHHVPILDSRTFDDFDAAEAWVREHPARYVAKPCGDADRALTYCARSAADLVCMLRRWRATRALSGPFMLQRFAAGIEMAAGGWFGPGGWHRRWVENWEFKRLMNGELGVATGEQGTVLRYVAASKLAERVLAPLGEFLHAIDYVGYVDQNCIVDDAGDAWPLEFTCRPGWPLFNIQQAVHRGDPATWMADLLAGGDTLESAEDVALGVVVSIADYPYQHLPASEVRGIPLYGTPPAAQTHLFQVMSAQAPCPEGDAVVERECLVTCGNNVMTVSGAGDCVEGAMRSAYGALRYLDMPGAPMYRTDIGARLERELPRLHANGYATGLDYRASSVSRSVVQMAARRSVQAAASSR
jgi:phosphoribosylamine--glycine ligase